MGKFNSVNKGKLCRRFGVNLFGNLKYDRIMAKRSNPPGQHGANAARKKLSEFGRQMIEKQKLKITYGLRERQFVNYYSKAHHAKGITGDLMLGYLETRLDNVVFRLGFAPSRSAARQMVSHGHFKVNGRRCNIASYCVRINDEITVKDSARSKALVQRNLDSARAEVPQWLILTRDEFKGQAVRLPLREEMPNVSDMQMVVEFYSK